MLGLIDQEDGRLPRSSQRQTVRGGTFGRRGDSVDAASGISVCATVGQVRQR
jgi:hypothetical protein